MKPSVILVSPGQSQSAACMHSIYLLIFSKLAEIQQSWQQDIILVTCKVLWTSPPKTIYGIFLPNACEFNFLLFQEKLSHLEKKIFLFPHPLHLISTLQLVYH